MKPKSPFYRDPENPNFNRRAAHHDYHGRARYLLTMVKAEGMPIFSKIGGNPADISSIETILTPTGKAIETAINDWHNKYSLIWVAAKAIMPDHIHLCVYVNGYLKEGLGRAVSWLKGQCSRLNAYSLGIELNSLFSPGFNDRIAYDNEQWIRQCQYTDDNPRRLLIKRQYKDLLLDLNEIKIGEREYAAKGNILLLRQPHLFRVKVSRHFTPAELADWKNKCKNAILNGSIPVSPFINPHEKEIRDYAIAIGSGYIRIAETGFHERETAVGKEFELMSEGKLLIIAPEEVSTRKQDLTYAKASSLNKIALQLVEQCNQGHPGVIRKRLSK